MNYFELNPRSNFAGYWPDTISGQVNDPRITEHDRNREVVVSEYLGEPPGKPKKRGVFHKSATGYFIRADVVELFKSAANGKIILNRSTLVEREDETFYQAWVINFVDCLDIKRTSFAPTLSNNPIHVGVIKYPVFDESRWDGSDLFAVPQDPSYSWFCTERFIEKWKALKFKGASFSRNYMDGEAIKC